MESELEYSQIFFKNIQVGDIKIQDHEYDHLRPFLEDESFCKKAIFEIKKNFNK